MAGDIARAGQHFAWMRSAVSIETGGVALDHRAEFGRKVVVAAINRVFHTEQVPKKVGLRALFAEMRAKSAAGGEDDELDRGEVVLRMRHGEAVSRFGIIDAV